MNKFEAHHLEPRTRLITSRFGFFHTASSFCEPLVPAMLRRVTGTLALVLLCVAACGVPLQDRPTPKIFGSLAAGQAKGAAVRQDSEPARGDFCRAERASGLVRCYAGCGGDGRGLRLRLRGGAQAGEKRGAPRDVGAPGYMEAWNMDIYGGLKYEDDSEDKQGPSVYEMEVRAHKHLQRRATPPAVESVPICGQKPEPSVGRFRGRMRTCPRP